MPQRLGNSLIALASKRIPRKYIDELEAVELEVPEGVTKASVFGASLLAGLLYCGHCGKRLVGGYNTHYRTYGVDHRPIYRCYNGAVKAKECDGQTTYSGVRVDEAVYAAVQHYFQTIGSCMGQSWKANARKRFQKGAKEQLKQAHQRLERLQREQDGLKKELLRVITGESAFDRDMLRDMMDENAQAQRQAEESILAAEAQTDLEEKRIREIETTIRNVRDWAAIYDEAPQEVQKSILAKLIDRIEIRRGYEMKILFRVEASEIIDHETESKYNDLAS